MKNFYLTPGPSELYFTVESHIKTAFQQNIMAISHRSSDFKKIFQAAQENLRTLLGIPQDYQIVFTGSANEIWERIVQNTVEKESFHFVNGSFSDSFYKFSKELGKTAHIIQTEWGKGFDFETCRVPSSAEMLALTINETSTGVAIPMQDLQKVRLMQPDAILAIDAVSTLPYAQIPYKNVDTVFFSVQKAFGLPAGLGVWIYNEKCVEKAKKLQSKGISIGTYHALPRLHEYALNYQTPETPNVLGIYLLSKVCEDFLNRGIQAIRTDIDYKAALLYELFDAQKNGLTAFVKNPKNRSQTVLVADVMDSAAVIAEFKKYGLVLGSGYGTKKGTQIRIANFPTHSRELFELVYDKMQQYFS